VHGAPTSLYTAAGYGTAVVVFYCGVWCPYCNIALSVYQQHLLLELTDRGVRLIAISPQAPDGSLSVRDKHGPAFTVLSDPGNSVARGLAS
jgi:peroxiredoxin